MPMMQPTLGVLCDYPEEGWPSMDLCAEMLIRHLGEHGTVRPARVCPSFRRLTTGLPILGRRDAASNADRLLNRFILFPRYARRSAPRFDLFHVVDHTYAQLVHALPAGRTGVYCHDLDAFRCLLDTAADPRPRWFRALARRILTGLQKAAVVFHSTTAVGEQINRAGLVPPDRLVLAPMGSHPSSAPTRRALGRAPLARRLGGGPWVLHVGSCIPRKRIDVLLDVFAGLRRAVPGVRLVKVGGEWSAGHRSGSIGSA
jgi:hypothetical protein